MSWWGEFLDDFSEAAGGPIGILLGFVLPFVAAIMALGVLLGWWA